MVYMFLFNCITTIIHLERNIVNKNKINKKIFLGGKYTLYTSLCVKRNLYMMQDQMNQWAAQGQGPNKWEQEGAQRNANIDNIINNSFAQRQENASMRAAGNMQQVQHNPTSMGVGNKAAMFNNASLGKFNGLPVQKPTQPVGAGSAMQPNPTQPLGPNPQLTPLSNGQVPNPTKTSMGKITPDLISSWLQQYGLGGFNG